MPLTIRSHYSRALKTYLFSAFLLTSAMPFAPPKHFPANLKTNHAEETPELDGPIPTRL